MVVLNPPHPQQRHRSYHDAYNGILAKHRSLPTTSASSVIILVALDVDALCAGRMLSELLKQDDVLHRLIPVSGMYELEQYREELRSYKEVRASLTTRIFISLCSPAPHANSPQHGSHSRSAIRRMVWRIWGGHCGPCHRLKQATESVDLVRQWQSLTGCSHNAMGRRDD
jgi:hypothetical protein